MAFAYRNWPGENLPSFLDVLLGKKVELLWYMRRIPMEELPAGHEELQRFCYQLFEHKVSGLVCTDYGCHMKLLLLQNNKYGCGKTCHGQELVIEITKP